MRIMPHYLNYLAPCTMERRFTEADLNDLSRNQLVELVEAQLHLWPTASKGKFRRGKTNMKAMTDALLTCQFTTRQPLPSASSGHVSSLAAENSVVSQSGANAPIAVMPNAPIASIPPIIMPNVHIPPAIINDVEASHVDEEPSRKNVVLEAMDKEALSRESCSIVLLIEDTRHLFNDKISQRIEVPVIDSSGGMTHVGAKDVITALQGSISAFEGPARLGIPDVENPEFTKFFGTLEGIEYIGLDEHEPELLVVPRNGRLEITVARIGGARTSVKEEKPNALPFPDPFTQFEEFAKTEQVRLAASPAATRVKKKSPKPLTSEERDWLTAKVQAMEGFETFQKQHGQRLNNLNRVLYWKFAANFTQKYYKTEWPILSIEHEHSNGTVIRKHALETILDMKTTGLNQAINMSRILAKCYHGASKSPEVVNFVEDTTSVSLGSEPLVNFLLEWEKDHPGFGRELD
ncbi:hypothetical protein C8F04DRAFT_1143932 [Mycena alexandri]|uniref:Uncharacterized protein n=1 Tax=Mycena alexandri TaxID=1745969 RepID=A0AAD6S4S3_9AGAR|nr:hypothetical protein C8F04DRAFT_1161209 [Mycena alexandri]KAJ7020478.1 hypothetical protein C8F04DRAFT_1143932 [Mycena alexandri]